MAEQKTGKFFEIYLGSILDPRLRQRLLHQLWQEATKQPPSLENQKSLPGESHSDHNIRFLTKE